MEDSLLAEVAEAGMAVDDLYLLADYDIAKDWEEGKDRWKGGLPVDDKERHMVDFKAVGEISDSSTAFICMSDYDDLVSSVDKFLYIINQMPKDDIS